VVPLYLDDCLIDKDVARPLRAAGHLLYLTSELGVKGQEDELHLEKATELGAVLVTQNQQDFARLYKRWQAEDRRHAGIILVRQKDPIGTKIDRLDRVARILTGAAARNQLMYLAQFDTDEDARSIVASFTSGP